MLNHEKILTTINSINAEIKSICELYNLTPLSFTDVNAGLEEIYREIAQELGAKNARLSGCGDVFKAFNRIINGTDNDSIKGAFRTKKGYLAVLDGYHGIRLFDSGLNNVQMLSDKYQPIDFDNIVESAAKSAANYVTVSAPSVRDLRTFVRMEKAEWKATHSKYNKQHDIEFVFANSARTMVNAEFLSNILEALPDAEIWISNDRNTSPIYFKSADGDAVLLPLRYHPGSEEGEPRYEEMTAKSDALMNGTYFTGEYRKKTA